MVAHLGFVAHGDQFERHAHGGQAQVASAHVVAGHKHREGAGFGHAQARAHDDALADLALLGCVQAVPNGLGQGRARVEKHAHPAEQIAPQCVIGLQGVGDGLKAGGHIEVNGGCHLAQVAQGLAHQGGGGLAVVDVQGAAVVNRQAHIVVAAKGVVPRQPVNQHRWLFGQQGHGLAHLLLVGAPHALGVDHPFGQLGRA